MKSFLIVLMSVFPMVSHAAVDVVGLPSMDEEDGTESRQVLSNDAASMPHLSLMLSDNNVMPRDLEYGHFVR